MSTTVVALVTEPVHRELPMPAWAYGLIAFGLLMLAFLALWSFRGTAQKWAGAGASRSTGHNGASDDAHHGGAHH